MAALGGDCTRLSRATHDFNKQERQMEEWGFRFADAPARLAAPDFVEKRANVLRLAQNELIDEMRQAAERWCTRRHEGVEAAFDLSVASMNYPGPVRAAETWMRFCRGAVRRMSEDAADQLQLSVAVARSCGDGLLMPAAERPATSRSPNRVAMAARKRAKPRASARRPRSRR
jgi:hypothetical protein